MGTLRIPEVVPSPAQDCERLKKAFQGWGTDEEGIIWLLGHRNADQRRKIRDTYQQLYNKSLIDDLHSELSGDFRKAVILWIYDPPERDAKLANEALKKNGLKSLQVIAGIACASSSDYLMAVRQAYCSLFDCSLEEDIASQFSPPLRKLLVGLVSSYRQSKEIVDLNVAKSEAAKLHELINGKHLDHDDLMFILSTRNFFQLRATFDCYKQEYGEGIAQDISNSGNGDLEALLKVVISCIAYPEKHFAEDIRASIEGLGTDEDSLTRAIVRRAEVDMVKIKEEYLKMYGSSIDNAVAGDTSGDYKEFLLTLIGAKF
ncbi:hypothetical protein Ancab_006268 [Ancistrocladus abbreviatus]